MTTIITMTMIAVCPHGWVLLESMAVAVTMLSMVDACQSLWTIASRITISLRKMLGKSEEENVENSLLTPSPSNHLSLSGLFSRAMKCVRFGPQISSGTWFDEFPSSTNIGNKLLGHFIVYLVFGGILAVLFGHGQCRFGHLNVWISIYIWNGNDFRQLLRKETYTFC